MEVTTFTCSICGEGSRDICVFCTKDACANHLCERCRRCSDCCECEVRLMNLDRVEAEHSAAQVPDGNRVQNHPEPLTPTNGVG